MPDRKPPKMVQSPFTGQMVPENRLSRAEREAIKAGKTYAPKARPEVRKEENLFPARERPGAIVDKGYIGKQKHIHVYNANPEEIQDTIDLVNKYVREKIPDNMVIQVVAFGMAYVTSGGRELAHFPEHRTVLLNTPKEQFESRYYQTQLRLACNDFYNPENEKHEIDYFSIRYRPSKYLGR